MKTGISHARLRPTLAVVDPALTMTQPAGVTAAAGMDILCHALESYTARPVHLLRPQDARAAGALLRLEPDLRPVVGAGDDAAGRPRSAARSTTATTRRRASRWRWPRRWPGSASATPACTSRTRTPTRSPAGSRDFRLPPTGYPADEPMVPHGMAVSLTAPEAFRWTFSSSPERHLRAAALLAPGHELRRRPDALPRGAGRPDARHRASRTGSAPSATTRATSTTWSRGR